MLRLFSTWGKKASKCTQKPVEKPRTQALCESLEQRRLLSSSPTLTFDGYERTDTVVTMNFTANDPDTSVDNIVVYHDTDDSGELNPGDLFIAPPTNISGNTWQLLVPIEQFDVGANTVFAAAFDTDGIPSAVQTFNIQRPQANPGPHWTLIIADNRGQVQMTANRPMDESTLNSRAFRAYLRGPDNQFNTDDDERIRTTNFNYVESSNRIEFRAIIGATNTPYRIRVFSKWVTDEDGRRLDGEFDGRYPTGNGIAGGDTKFINRAVFDQPTVRFQTSAGNMNATLRTDIPELTDAIDNFLYYVNNAWYDLSILHRSSKESDGPPLGLDVLQGGQFRTNANSTIEVIDTQPAIPLAAGISNLRGTIAFARTADLDSATSQFFLNFGDNSDILDISRDGAGNINGGYTAFAEITQAGSLATLDRLVNFPRVFCNSNYPVVPVRSDTHDCTDFNNDPLNTGVLLKRVSVRARVQGLPGLPADQLTADAE